MRKSTVFFSGAVALWISAIAWSLVTIIYNDYFHQLRATAGSRYAFISFGMIFAGIFLARKGSEYNNIERGRPADYAKPITKTRRVLRVALPVLYLLVAIILILKNFQHI